MKDEEKVKQRVTVTATDVGSNMEHFTQTETASVLMRRNSSETKEPPVPLHVRQPGGVPETFGKGVTVNLQFGYLGKHSR